MNINLFKAWPHLTVMAVICALVSTVAIGWWAPHEQTAFAAGLQNAARSQRVAGGVALKKSEANDDWVQVTPNRPFTISNRIYKRENSHTSLAVSARNFARLNSNTSLDVLSLADRHTQLALTNGSVVFDVGSLAPGELFEVATLHAPVDFRQSGLYDVGMDNGTVLVSVLTGLAQVADLGGNGRLSKDKGFD
jgi:hypothetical protein